MNNLIKIVTMGIFGTLFVSGCMTEQEKLVYEKAKQEKAAQEQAERIKANKSAIESAYKHRIEKYWSDIAEHNYNFIQAKYAACGRQEYRRSSDKVLNRYRECNDKTPDCLNVWVDPRLDLSEDEKMKGRALLEGFGSRYLPNAYANYDKAKESAEEIQQMFNENFPEPWSIKPNNPKWSAYCKLLKGLCKARSKYFRAHDELAHFYIMHKVGAATGDDLAKLDQGKIVILLLEENGNDIVFPTLKHEELDPKTCDFGTKYAPEAYATYTKLKRDRDESLRLYMETQQEGRLIDAVRFNLATIALCEKINYLTLTMDKIGADIRTLYMDHKTMDKDAEAIAKTDHGIAMRWKPFLAILPKYIYDRANGPLIPVGSAMNTFYPNTEIRKWHWYALGFPDCPDSNRKWNGFDSHYYFYNDIITGARIDSLSMADYISGDHILLFEYSKWLAQHQNNKSLKWSGKYRFKVPTGRKESKVISSGGCGPDWYEFRYGYSQFGRGGGRLNDLEELKNRSAKNGILYASPDTIMSKFSKYTWSDWTGAGEEIPLESPFEMRLNEFNRGKCYCEVVVSQDKKNRRSEQWWRVVAK